MGRRLYVGNISYSSGEEDLRELFGKVGAVESVSIPTDMATGRPRGFAFVEMNVDDDATRAIDELNQAEFQGRRLTVNEARPKAARPPTDDPGFDGGRREPRW
jgi:cold-inducible RNA-binding protein